MVIIMNRFEFKAIYCHRIVFISNDFRYVTYHYLRISRHINSHRFLEYIFFHFKAYNCHRFKTLFYYFKCLHNFCDQVWAFYYVHLRKFHPICTKISHFSVKLIRSTLMKMHHATSLKTIPVWLWSTLLKAKVH